MSVKNLQLKAIDLKVSKKEYCIVCRLYASKCVWMESCVKPAVLITFCRMGPGGKQPGNIFVASGVTFDFESV